MIIMIIILAFLVIMSGFFSGSEIVYIKVNNRKLSKLADKGDKSAKAALELANNYTPLLSTILAGNALVNIAASSLATTIAVKLWPENGDLIAIFGMTMIVLIFGEILPKTILSKYNFRISLLFARLLKLFQMILKPVVISCTYLVNKMSFIWTPKHVDEEDTTDEELINMVDEISEDGYIDEDTKDLIKAAIDFGDTEAYEIMTHRVDVCRHDIDDDISELLKDPDVFNYSQIPVFKDTFDNVIGLINAKELLMKLLNDELIDDVSKLVYPALFVHKTKSVSELLREFKEKHVHFAIVKDEYGGTMGIVTLEDIIEDIVGDIFDETDVIEEEYEKISDNKYIIDGEMNIFDLFEDLLDYDASDFDKDISTVGGWCTDMLEKFPEVGEVFRFENFEFKILIMDKFKVEKVELTIMNDEED